MLEEPSQRGELEGDRSSCWLADGEHLQHGGLPKKEQAAASSRYTEKAGCTSSGWKARGKEMQREPSEAPYSTGLSTGSVHFFKPKSKVSAQPRSPSLR